MSKKEEPQGYYLHEKGKLEKENILKQEKYKKTCLFCLWLWIMEKGREFQKNIYFCFSDYAIAFDCAQLGGSEQSHVAGKTYSGRLEDFQRSL